VKSEPAGKPSPGQSPHEIPCYVREDSLIDFVLAISRSTVIQPHAGACERAQPAGTHLNTGYSLQKSLLAGNFSREGFAVDSVLRHRVSSCAAHSPRFGE
jgi:hypothetical protein